MNLTVANKGWPSIRNDPEDHRKHHIKKTNDVVSWSIKVYSFLLGHISYFLLWAPPHFEPAAHKTRVTYWMYHLFMPHLLTKLLWYVQVNERWICKENKGKFYLITHSKIALFLWQLKAACVTLHSHWEQSQPSAPLPTTNCIWGVIFLQSVLQAPPSRKPYSERWRILAYHSFRNRMIFRNSFWF